MNKAILIDSEDWEGLFVNGKLVEEGHTLNQGYNRINYFKKLAKKYNFNLYELESGFVTPEYQIELENYGGFPDNIKDVKYIVENLENEDEE